ncbi:hypothetical protein [Pontibacter pamirensis]|nr:hypothetical protein [Pontibacter pamirensis]
MRLQTAGSLWLQEHFKLTRFVLTHRFNLLGTPAFCPVVRKTNALA